MAPEAYPRVEQHRVGSGLTHVGDEEKKSFKTSPVGVDVDAGRAQLRLPRRLHLRRREGPLPGRVRAQKEGQAALQIPRR
jgi:hypothetical protein